MPDIHSQSFIHNRIRLQILIYFAVSWNNGMIPIRHWDDEGSDGTIQHIVLLCPDIHPLEGVPYTTFYLQSWLASTLLPEQADPQTYPGVADHIDFVQLAIPIKFRANVTLAIPQNSSMGCKVVSSAFMEGL